MDDSSSSPRKRKAKPAGVKYARAKTPRFPLWKHKGVGYWARKHKGTCHYFGRVADDPTGDAALAKMAHDWPYIIEGRTPPPMDAGDRLTLVQLSDAFLHAKQDKLEAGELAERSFADYHRTCSLLLKQFGPHRRVDDLRPDDFAKLRKAMAAKWGAVTLSNEITRIRVVLKFAFDERLIDRPVHYGQSLNRPTAKVLREKRNEAGPRMFAPEELRRILKALKPDTSVFAMTLLAANTGMGNSDLAAVPESAVDFDSGWLTFPRVKTAVPRRIPLWPETLAAIRKAIAKRPKPKDRADAGLLFLTVTGRRWVRVQPKRNPKEGETAQYVRGDSIAMQFTKTLRTLGINGHRGFYTLRHVMQTIGGEARDPEAVSAIMGHTDSSMGAVYREGISDGRLRAVVETVREWLWPAESERSERDEARE